VKNDWDGSSLFDEGPFFIVALCDALMRGLAFPKLGREQNDHGQKLKPAQQHRYTQDPFG